MSLSAGTQLGPYEILASLGAGGMGEVYRARDTRLDREVAVKVLPETFAHDRDRAKRFEREAKAVAALSHPNILALYDVGADKTVSYAVMELLEGESLRQRLTSGPLPWRKAVEIGVAIAEGLAAAHAKGIIHRDLKPDNLFLTRDGRVKILDFGLARLEGASTPYAETGSYHPAQTETGTVMGTAGYMSPEQVRGQDADTRSDIFSLGCVLYEMVTGQRAFSRETSAETMTAILHEEPPELSDSKKQIPIDVERLIRHCLEKSREERFQTARDLGFALKAVLSGSGVAGISPARSPSRPGLWLAAALTLVGIVGVSAYLITRDGETLEPVKPAEPAKAFDSLAILPFVNESGDAQLDYLSDGFSEDLIDRLYLLPKLKVMSRDAVFRYKGKETDAQTVGRALGVKAVLAGRLRLRGQALSIHVELVNATDNSRIWGDKFDHPLTEIQALRDSIVRQIAVKLHLRLTGEEEARLTRQHTPNPDAYLLYQQGSHHWRQDTGAELRTALCYFQRAIELDPNYAAAWSGVGRSYAVLAGEHMPPREARAEIKKAVAKALQLDDQDEGGNIVAGGFFLFHERDLVAAESALRRALHVNPRSTGALYLYGRCLAERGQLAEAIAMIEQARDSDPYSLAASRHLMGVYYQAKQDDQVIAEARRMLALTPNFARAHDFIALVHLKRDMPAEAVAILEEARKLAEAPSWLLAHLGYAYARAGRRAEAQQVLAELQALAAQRYVPPLRQAVVYAGLGENDQALHWLRRAFEDQSLLGPAILRDRPFWDDLRSDPRFIQLLKDMGLADKVSDGQNSR